MIKQDITTNEKIIDGIGIIETSTQECKVQRP